MISPGQLDFNFSTKDLPKIQVPVEPEVTRLTWEIIDKENGRVVQSGTIRRKPGPTDGTIEIPADPLSKSGEYELEIKIVEVSSNALPAEGPRNHILHVKEADTEHGYQRNPFQVSLTPRAVPHQVDPGLFVDFNEFQRVHLSEVDENEAFMFGSTGSYETRLTEALNYVRAHCVVNFGELMPRNYLEKRADDSLDPELAITGIRKIPAVELIWNYWQEEGMLVQTLNVILARFQNRRLPGRNPLARFDVTPLLPLRNLLWGFSEAEMHRTTLRRRAAEYEYEYGLSLIGRAVPPSSSNVERRSAFLDAFHQVLHTSHIFYKEVDDLTINADAYPLSQALRDCHVVLSQGSQNQYGEMAVTARAEFLVLQSILAEKEMREFLGGRPMTPYPEGWMDRVDSMKTIQGWDDVSVMHYHDLATLGEKLVLTIRLGNWAAPDVGAAHARTWALAFRESVQRYTSAYRSVTGVDLARQTSSELPSQLIAGRIAGQRNRA